MTMNRRMFGRTLLAAGAASALALPSMALPSLAQAHAKTDRTKATSAPADAPMTVLPPRSPFLSYEGRTANLANGLVRASFPGVVLRIAAVASRVVLKTEASSENVYIDVAVDGAPSQMVHLAPGAQDLVLFDGAAGEHHIEMTRRTESWEGQWDIAGVEIHDGHALTPAALAPHRLMFIGDSITCGAACDVARDDPRQDMTINNAHKTYGKLLAARLNSQCHLVSYGGRGIMRDWQGIRDTNNAPQFYERAAPDEPALLWDHSSYVPDAIGICLGTNDFSQGIPDQNEFINTYVEFVEKLRRDAPKAHIFLIDSPMLSDDGMPRHTVCGAYLGEIVKRAASPLVTHALVAYLPGRVSNGHPIAEDHVIIADTLEPLFRAVLA